MGGRPVASGIPVDLGGLDPEVRARLFRPRVLGGRFKNPWDTPPRPGLRDVLRWQAGRTKGDKRVFEQPRFRHPLGAFRAMPEQLRLLWLGHASFLIELDGVRLLIDPILGRAGGLVPRVTPLPVAPAAIERPHAILFTHGHHDHLDVASVRALARSFDRDVLFIVPKGLEGVLPPECRRIVALEWWHEVRVEGVRVGLVPAQHWHRRGLFDEDRALWGGYVISGSRSVYHSGDTGYFEGFRAIGQAYGGVDVAILPLGAYEPRWFMHGQHMAPEQSAEAFRDLGARHFVGMHWGTFDLSDESVDAGPRLLMRHVEEDDRFDPRAFHVLEHGGSLGVDARGDVAIEGETAF